MVFFTFTLWLSAAQTVPHLSRNDDNYNISKLSGEVSLINPYGLRIDPINSTTLNISGTVERIKQQISSSMRNSEDFKIKISYQLIANEPLAKLLCDYGDSSFDFDGLKNNRIGLCRADLHGFGRWKSTENWNELDTLEKLCEPNYIYLNYSREFPNNHVLIANLLPYQAYHFRQSIDVVQDNSTTSIKKESYLANVCLPEGPPTHGPQADHSSFFVNPQLRKDEMKEYPGWNNLSQNARAEIQEGNFRRITLFWRTVPMHLLTSRDIYYNIICRSGLVVNYSANVSYLTGNKDVEFPFRKNMTYRCEIFSKNRFGESDSSTIIVHRQKDLVDTEYKHDRFELFVTRIIGGDYILSWTDMDNLLLDQATPLETTKSVKQHGFHGIYTYHWCVEVSASIGCTSIEGFGRTNETLATLKVRNYTYSIGPRLFGISYTFPNSSYSTGIVWADCVSSLHSQGASILNSVPITKVNQVPGNQTVLHVFWSPRGCRGIYAVIGFFNLTYCKVRAIDPCSSSASKNRTHEETSMFKLESLPPRNCANISVASPANGAIVSGLEPSTEYVFQLEHLVVDQPANRTEPTFAETHIEPTMQDDCLDVLNWALLTCALISVVIIALCTLYSARNRYKEFKSRLNVTNSGMPRRIERIYEKGDNFSEIGLKFWINRDSASINADSLISKSESSLNQSNRVDKPSCTVTFNNESTNVPSDDVDDIECNMHSMTALMKTDDHPRSRENEFGNGDTIEEAEIKEKKEESETKLFKSSMPGYVPRSQLFSNSTQSYSENPPVEDSPLQDNQDWTPPESLSDRISVTSHSSFLKNIFNDLTAQENY